MIEMVDPKAEYGAVKDEIDKAVLDVADSGRYILGPNVDAFEKEFAAYIGVRHAIGVASGTDALRISLLAAGMQPGDEVITSPFSFMATADSIAQIGAVPVFVDIDPTTFNIDPRKIEHKITSRTKALMPVHIYGQPCDMYIVSELAEEYGLKVIEDCAQSTGAAYSGKKTGALGDAGAFSFFPTKNLGCMGDGGMITTDDENIAGTARQLRAHGAAAKYEHEILGYNSRLDEVQAAILRIKLKMLDGWIVLRRKAAKTYDESMDTEYVTRSETIENASHAYNLYTVRSENRDALASHMEKNGIVTGVYYRKPLHLQKALAYLGYEKNSLKEAETASREVLSLPMHPHLTPEQTKKVVLAVNSFDPYK